MLEVKVYQMPQSSRIVKFLPKGPLNYYNPTFVRTPKLNVS